jgi:hypothetical protein
MKFQQKTIRSGLRATLSALAAALLLPAHAAPDAFRAPHVEPQVVELAAPVEKSTAPAPRGLSRVGDVRPLPKAAALSRWHAVEGGYAARLQATSRGAQGLRVRLELGPVPGAMEIRVQGTDAARMETMALDPTLGNEAWTPWTEGDTQTVEIFSPSRPSAEAVRVAALVHFTASPFAKAAASCTISTTCSSGDATLDALIAERKRSLARILFTKNGGAFACSATLIETPRAPAPYVLTANHCTANAAEAGSVTFFWFYEGNGCPASGVNPGFVQTGGGAQLAFTSPSVDSTLLLMNQPPPAGTAFAPLNSAPLAEGTPVVSLSHPDADTSRWAEGAVLGVGRTANLPYDMYIVSFSRGLIEGGSSGSGLFTRANGRLELAGVLSFELEDNSCTADERLGIYDRLEVLAPQMARYIGAAAEVADDAPNQVSEAATAVGAGPIDLAAAQPAVTLARRIDYAGDVDTFRFTLSATAAVSAYTQGTQDLVGAIVDANGESLETNDDVQTIDNNAGITRVLQPGTYYFQVAHWVPAGTGPYEVVLRADRVDANYTALWWNPAESGWGINLDHQGDIVFATLFTYDETGAPMWLVMSRGERQPDGTYSGQLFRTTGPAFNTVPWTSITPAEVGTMRLAFAGANDATLTYTYNGRAVTKQITRQVFKTLPTCAWSIFDRSFESNVQDLWWNPLESGWGINLAHQEDTLFATLFTYDATGRGLWLVMPEGTPDATGIFRGALYRTRGPAFDAQPWTGITFAQVGTMSLDFAHGNSATLTYTVDGVPVTKSITRQVFSSPKTKCES